MRKLLLATLSLFFWTVLCHASPAMVGCPSTCNICYSALGSGAQTCSMPTSTTAGNAILVGIRFAGNGGAITCCDSGAHTFTQIADTGCPGTTVQGACCTGSTSSDGCISLYRYFNIAGGAETCSVTVATSINNQIVCAEVSGLTTTDPFDVQHYNDNATATTAPTTGSTATTAQASEYLFAIDTSVGGNITTCTAGTSYTVRGTFSNRLCYQDQTVSSTGTESAAWTTNSVAFAAAIATMKASGGAAAVLGFDKERRYEQVCQ